ncbi:MAG: murein biosynthesis integral membrane protein MurJ [Actinomycetes bacterium]
MSEPRDGAPDPAPPAASDPEDASLVRASATMAVGTVLSRLTGFVRNAVVVAAIGSLVFADTYNLANTVPNILYILLIGGTLNSVFIPQLVRSMKKDADGGEAYAQRLLTLTACVLLVVTVAAVALAPLVIDVYASDKYSQVETDLAVTFARFCLPQIFFYGVYAMFQQMLNSRGRFGPPMYTPILNNVVGIAMGVAFLVVTGGEAPSAENVTTGEVQLLGLGTTLGIVVQALGLLPFLGSVGFRLRPRFDWRGAGLGKAGDLAGWAIVFVLVNQVAYAVIVRLASGAGKEGEAAGLGYGVGFTVYQTAYLLFILPHSVVTVSVVTALLPRMSSHAADNRLAEVTADISTGLRLTAVAIVPAAVLFLVLGREAGVTIYSLGNPGLQGSVVIGLTLAAFGLGLVPFSVFHLLLRGFYAQENTRTPALINIWVNAANLGAAFALVAVLPVRQQVIGLAVAYGLSYVVGMVIACVVLRRRIGSLDGRAVLRTYGLLGLAAVTAGALAFAVTRICTATLGEGFGGSATGLALGVVVGLAVYAGLALKMRVPAVTELISVVRARLGG